MKIQILSAGNRMPSWITEGYQHYAKRLPNSFALTLHEIPLPKRGSNTNIEHCLLKESKKMQELMPKNTLSIALASNGTILNTQNLATRLSDWQLLNQNVSFLIGGPDGLHQSLLTSADEIWSLSRCIFPHALVRIILAEQLYRAASILSGHPYHRP